MKFKKILLFFYNFIMIYIPNYFVTYFPSYSFRNFYYKYIMQISIESGSSIHMGTYINRSNIKIGQNTAINRNCYLDGRGELVIGSNVSISPGVKLITADHDLQSKDFKFRKESVVIEDYVWIGTGVIILPGVKIKKGAVVAAGSVVTKDIPEFCVYGGVPAKFIKNRNKDLNYKCDWFPPFD